MHTEGTHPSLEKMSKEVPAGVLEMLAIPGLRPDKVLKNLSRLLARRHLAFEHFAICTTCSICSTEVMRTPVLRQM